MLLFMFLPFSLLGVSEHISCAYMHTDMFSNDEYIECMFCM